MFEDFRIKIFLSLCRLGSFTAVARELRISQPAVSHNISELEKILGVTLFERGRSGAVLTEEGLVFKDCAEQIQASYASALEALQGTTEAARLPLDSGTDARVWTSGGEIHISIKKK